MKNICHLICTLFLFSATSVFGQGLITEQAPLPCLNKKFTIVAHIARDTFGMDNVTEEEILTALEEAKPAFDPICVDFEICEFRYIDNFQYDNVGEAQWAEMQVKYNQNNRINMYFASSAEISAVACGFATLGGITMMENGGIVIVKEDCLVSQTIIHELGHYFGLLHTFEGNGAELVDGSNCDIEGDLVCDTPADPYTEGDPLVQYIDEENGCRFISQLTDANGTFYEPDVGNYMSYYPRSCRCGFTYQQYLRMVNTYQSVAEMW